MILILLTAFLILITAVDYKTKVIPDGLSLLGIVLALNYQMFYGSIKVAVFGINAGIASIWIMNCLLSINILHQKIDTSRARLNGVGGGDAKLMAFIGACLGWQMAFLTSFLAWLIFLPVKRTLKNSVAYSPYIFGACVISLILRFIWTEISSLGI